MSDQPKSQCPSCGIAWTDHLGITWTCARVKELQGKLALADAALARIIKTAPCVTECISYHHDKRSNHLPGDCPFPKRFCNALDEAMDALGKIKENQ